MKIQIFRTLKNVRISQMIGSCIIILADIVYRQLQVETKWNFKRRIRWFYFFFCQTEFQGKEFKLTIKSAVTEIQPKEIVRRTKFPEVLPVGLDPKVWNLKFIVNYFISKFKYFKLWMNFFSNSYYPLKHILLKLVILLNYFDSFLTSDFKKPTCFTFILTHLQGMTEYKITKFF